MELNRGSVHEDEGSRSKSTSSLRQGEGGSRSSVRNSGNLGQSKEGARSSLVSTGFLHKGGEVV